MPSIFDPGLDSGNKIANDKGKKLVASLIDGNSLIRDNLFDIEVLWGLLVNPDKGILHGMRSEFRSQFYTLQKTLEEHPDNPELIAKLNLCLSLLPLAGIKRNDTYSIPSFNTQNNQWEIVRYIVTPIELTPQSGLGRLALSDSNRMFAYGLTPIFPGKEGCSNPPPRLIFSTPQFSGQQGFFASLYLRFQNKTGFYRNCQQEIEQWLHKSTEHAKSKSIVHGMGHNARLAMELSFVETSTEHVTAINIQDAYTLSDKKLTAQTPSQPQVDIQLHKNHHNLGYIFKNWNVTNSEGEQLDKEKYLKNYSYNLIVGTILGDTAHYLLAMPFHYILIPVIRTILNHKMQLALLSILTMVYIMLPGLVMTEIGTALAIFTAAYFGYKLIEPLKVIFNFNEKLDAKCHEPDPLDIERKIILNETELYALNKECDSISQELRLINPTTSH